MIKDLKNELKRRKQYNKYYNGDITTVTITKSLKYKLEQILNSVDVFSNFNDMFVFFLYRFEERKTIFRLQVQRYHEQISIIRKHSDAMCRKVDGLIQSRNEIKHKLQRKTEEAQYLKQQLRKHGVINVWTEKYGGVKDEQKRNT